MFATFKYPNKKGSIFVVAGLLFLTILPLSHLINFMQNDDWVYYQAVQKLLNGKFYVDPYISANFYLQLLLGWGFSLILGIRNLPILTLAVSVLNFMIFTLIVSKFFVKSVLVSILVGLLFFFNPIHIYSVWGFMSENYYILFFLLAIYFGLKFEEKPSIKTFSLTNFSILAAYFIRQFSFVISLAFLIRLLVTKRFKYALVQLGLLGANLAFHYLILPGREYRMENNIELQKDLNFAHINSMVWACLIYVTIFTLPLVLACLIPFIRRIAHSKLNIPLLFTILGASAIAIITYLQFRPQLIGSRELYYFQNTLDRKGFYDDDIDGSKYYTRSYYFIYRNMELVARVGAIFLCFILFVNYRKTGGLLGLLFMGHLLLLALSPLMYDRYLLPLYPVWILLALYNFQLLKLPVLAGGCRVSTAGELAEREVSANRQRKLVVVDIIKEDISEKMLKVALVPFLVVIFLYSYNFSLDFILSNRYVWTKATQLVNKENADPHQIQATHAWKMLYPRTGNTQYLFSYDTFTTKPEIAGEFELVEKTKIAYPLNFFINPYIYLYKAN